MARLYFVQEGTIHRYPPPERCSARYGKEQLRDTVPDDVEPCLYCLRRWPEDDVSEELRHQHH